MVEADPLEARQRGEESQPWQGALLDEQTLEAGLGADGGEGAGREDELVEREGGEVGHGGQAVQRHHLGLVPAVDGQTRQGAQPYQRLDVCPPLLQAHLQLLQSLEVPERGEGGGVGAAGGVAAVDEGDAGGVSEALWRDDQGAPPVGGVGGGAGQGGQSAQGSEVESVAVVGQLERLEAAEPSEGREVGDLTVLQRERLEVLQPGQREEVSDVGAVEAELFEGAHPSEFGRFEEVEP